MAITTLQRKLTTAINKAQVQPPWNHLARHTAYEAKYEYPLRPGTMRTAIKLYGPILQAASLFNRESADQSLPYQNVFAEPYCMILRKTGKSTVTILETPLADGTTFLVACTGDTLRISVVETDGTRLPSVKFSDMDDHALGMIALAILPHIINVDITDGNGKLSEAIADIGKCLDDAGRDVWNSEAEIPDLAKDSAYFLDAAMCILKDKMVIDCGNNSADTPAEMEAFYFSNSDALTGALMCSYAGPNNWAPQFVHPTGNATLFASSQITIKDAKATFASYSAARNWTPQEKALIPVFDDDMPVMPETLRIANRNVLLAYTIDDADNAYWESDQQKKLDEVFNRFVGMISEKRFFAGYVLWHVPVEIKREFYIDTPLGKLKVYSKHEKDTPEDYPGVYVAYVDPNTMKETVLTMVEYDHHGANDGGSIYTRVYGNGLLEEPTESVYHEHLTGYDLALAKKLICDFCQREYGHDDISSFDNPERVDIAFTYTTDDLLGIQVCVDLVHFTISTYVQSSINEEPFEFLMDLEKYDSLADLCDYLECMRFEDLIAIPDSSWTKFCCSQIGLKWLRDEFRKGTRIKLSWMNDQQAPPSGTIGTVEFVDDMGNIHMKWDTGSSLSLCYGIDEFYEAKEAGGVQA